MMSAALLSQLRADPWFAAQPPEFQDALVQRGRTTRWKDQQFIFAAGDPADGLYAILSGSVHMVHLTSGGISSIYYVKQPPAWFGELSELDGRPRAQDAIAVGAVTLLHLSHATLQSMLAQQPVFWASFARLMAYRTRDLFDILETVTTRPARVRLARAILSFHRRDQTSADLPLVGVTQDVLARMIGSTRQTVSRILGDFEKLNWIAVHYRGIEIVDRPALRKIAND